MELTPEVVFALVESDDSFPVDFDDAWRWIQYSSKQKAEEALKVNLDEGIDFLTLGLKSTGGRPAKDIRLVVDGFKMFCQAAGTPKGKEVRRYFIACEKELKRRRCSERNETQADYKKRLHTATLQVYLLDDPVKWADRGRVFQESFYRTRLVSNLRLIV